LLAWYGHRDFRGLADNSIRIGEKFIDWSDRQLPIDDVLRSVSFYWLTETYPTSIYPYRDVSHSVYQGVTF
jgi:hypothetical protein